MVCCWAEVERKKKYFSKLKNNSFLLRNWSSPLKNAPLCCFKVPSFLLLRCRMQTQLFTKCTRIIAWQQKSLSASWELSLLTRRVVFKQCNISEKMQLVHSFTALNYKATDFHWGGETYRIQLRKKEHLREDKEVKIKTTCWVNSWITDIPGISCSEFSFNDTISLAPVTENGSSLTLSIRQYVLHLKFQTEKLGTKWRL